MEKPTSLPNFSLLTIKEVADFLRLSKPVIYRAVERGELPAVKWENTVRIPRQKLLALLSDQGENS